MVCKVFDITFKQLQMLEEQYEFRPKKKGLLGDLEAVTKWHEKTRGPISETALLLIREAMIQEEVGNE